ncbi:hypothetical protein GCM10009841_17820 [Microlunatus panaciterrae]|uniref:DNA-binding transcriptional ArsR family regulator n=1 Tax=Microlunatus panaciterrae TaxID=400768 RepID=A0ABS2RQA3_9ACTN|nr:winged helix-turn-helix domain-containing protein [Microlunatus panaciterrae]MBM7800341.1 DNA-binding transcriptional ArsR family regulator [Microlunatus panaciterrae]
MTAAEKGTPAPSEGSAVPMTQLQRDLQARWEKATGTRVNEVEIRDARAIRALAHEARQRVIDVLYAEQRPFTSTELAKLTGLSPSAMSYHLRALERWGVVERVPESADARERPWRAAGTGIRIVTEGAGGQAAAEALRSRSFAELTRRSRALRDLPPERRAVFIGMAKAELWLTDEQADFVAQSVDRAILELAEGGWSNEPGPGRTRVATFWSIMPEVPPPGAVDDVSGPHPS